MSFSERLQGLRKEKGLSQEGLAEILGVSRQAVAKWELGQSYPDIDNLVQLSNKFLISLDKLVKEEQKCSSKEETIESIVIDQEAVTFLIKAKRATYAGKGSEVRSSRLNSHDLFFEENEYKYFDTYLGNEKFSGEEAIWRNDLPFWAMNYCGRIVGEGFSGEFLKEALFLVNDEYPYRGPLVYQNGEHLYHCTIKGDFGWFNGYEEIFHNDKKVYECMFHGGFVK